MPRVLPLDPATYQRHRLHGEDRAWVETNCYTDVVIELLHAMGHEPTAALAFTLTIDLDVDQWTFFKFPYADVEDLYALAMFELATWRPLATHLEEQAAAGRPVLVELDSFYLPDTVGTAYGLVHTKSTVAVNAIDVAARTMEYFHNQSYHRLSGDDFVRVLQVDGLVHERMLPPYIEFVKPVPRQSALTGHALTEGSLRLLKKHVGRLPLVNPFVPFREKLAADLPWLQGAELGLFHAYSFATLRQLGACYALAGSYLGWLGAQGVDGLAEPAAAFDEIARLTKALQFQLARAMARKRPLDLAPIDTMAGLWDRAAGELTRRHG